MKEFNVYCTNLTESQFDEIKELIKSIKGAKYFDSNDVSNRNISVYTSIYNQRLIEATRCSLETCAYNHELDKDVFLYEKPKKVSFKELIDGLNKIKENCNGKI